jgi:hypothetical protein
MPSYFSYVDTSLRIVFVNRDLTADARDADELNAIFEELRTSPGRFYQLTDKILKKQVKDFNFNLLLFHESHHYWQSLYYPFLFYLCWIEFKVILDLKRNLRYKVSEAVLELSQIRDFSKRLGSVEYLNIQSKKFRMSWENETLDLDLSPITGSDSYDSNVFCLIDFIEDVTTLFQYKCSIVQEDDGLDYFKWVQNPMNKGYKKLYKLLVPVLGKELTYYLMPMFVQLAFHTTRPAEAFCKVVNYSIERQSDEKAWGNIYQSMKTFLKKQYPTTDYDLTKHENINELPPMFIELTQYKKIVDLADSGSSAMHYPLAVHAAKYISALQENPKLEMTLIYHNRSVRGFLLQTFCPFAIYFNFAQINSKNNFFFISKDYRGKKVGTTKTTYEKYIAELQNIKEITVSIFTNLNQQTPHNCSHIQCAYFKTDLCRRWNKIPQHQDVCEFPAWFVSTYGYRIDIEKGSLVKTSGKRQELNADEFTEKKREKDIPTFTYVRDENDEFTLTITNAEMKNCTADYFRAFIDHLFTDEEQKLAYLFGNIKFDFPEYKTRVEIIESPTIKEWFRIIKQYTPELMFYLDFDKALGQRDFLLAGFVKYKKESIKFKSGLEFDGKSLKEFVMKELGIMDEFFDKTGLKPSRYVTSVARNLNGLNI